MKAKSQLLKALAVLLMMLAGTLGAMAQPSNDSPTQEVCPGVEPYLINPGNPNNTFLWSIDSGTSGTEWTIESPTTAATNITWGNTITPQTYVVTFREVDPVTQCYDEVILTVTVNPEPLAPVGEDITVCETIPLQSITAVATAQEGATIVWYDAAMGGNVVADPTLSAVGSLTYYAEAVLGPCESSTRTPIVLTIEPAPLAPTGVDITVCETSPIQAITATATGPDGATIVWYDAETGGNVVADPTLNVVGSITYYAESVLGNCESLTRTPIVLTILPAPIPTISGPDALCALEEGNVYTTEAGMTNYTWIVSAGGTITAGGTPGDNSVTVTWNTEGPQTVSVNYENAEGCSAATPTVRNVTVNPIPATSPIYHN